MRKFLSIIIPRYKETEKDIFPLLSSINGQAGLDAAQGEYVMFCDADDILHNVGVLGALMQEAEKNAPDLLGSSWLEELKDGNGRCRYITHENENTWMHGKLLRRQFLTANGVRFHKTLRVHEDSYFLSLAASLSLRTGYLPITSYVWKYRTDSITRRNGAVYSYESIPEFIRACTLAYRELEKRTPEQMEYKVIQFTVYNYFSFHQPDWQMPEHLGYLKAAEWAFVKYVKPFWHYWQRAAPQVTAEIYNQERLRSFGGCVEQETVWDWIKRIGMDKGQQGRCR